jgi:hypothetical protein
MARRAKFPQWFEFDGRVQHVNDWAAEFGLTPMQLYHAIHDGRVSALKRVPRPAVLPPMRPLVKSVVHRNSGERVAVSRPTKKKWRQDAARRAAKIATDRRNAKMLRLHTAGMSYTAIAKRCGLTAQSVWLNVRARRARASNRGAD